MASVLIVDDQDMVRRTLRLALEMEGLDVREAGDGDEALRMYRLAPADVVVTDIVMPNKEGIETIFELRRSARSDEHTSELQSLMRISYAVFCLKKKKQH